MLYESFTDRQRQWAVADLYGWAHGVEVWMTPLAALLPWDAEFSRAGRVVSLAEVKVRTCTRWQYHTYKVDRAKVDAMLAAATRRGVRCGMLVEFADGCFKLPLSAAWLAAHATVSVIERKNRAGETPDVCWEWSNEWWQPIWSGA